MDFISDITGFKGFRRNRKHRVMCKCKLKHSNLATMKFRALKYSGELLIITQILSSFRFKFADFPTKFRYGLMSTQCFNVLGVFAGIKIVLLINLMKTA